MPLYVCGGYAIYVQNDLYVWLYIFTQNCNLYSGGVETTHHNVDLRCYIRFILRAVGVRQPWGTIDHPSRVVSFRALPQPPLM